jgi:CheY-like chemotaxis protein
MALSFEFLSPTDKPAMLALQNPAHLEMCRTALDEAGYKTHIACNHGEFIERFTQVQYQLIILEDCFDAALCSENLTLQNLQAMPMSQRRHATVLLVGKSFETLNALQAFQLSVHAVVNATDLESIQPIIQQVVTNSDLFLHLYRETQIRVAQGK